MGIIVKALAAAAATPAAGYSVIYPKDDGDWYFVDDAGNERKLITDASFSPDWFFVNKGGVDQTGVANGASTKITFTNEGVDTAGVFDAANSQFIPPDGQRWLIYAVVHLLSATSGSQMVLQLYKNGSQVLNGPLVVPGGSGQNPGMSVQFIVEGNGSDYYELQVFMSGASGSKSVSGAGINSYWQGTRLA